MTPAENVQETADHLLRLKLVSEPEVAAVRRVLTPDDWGDELLAALEKQRLLTSFQAEKLRKSDYEGLVLGDYKLMYKNASGSFARVYRACSLYDNTMVGLKVLRERWSNDPESVRMFKREGEVGLRLKHANIVTVHDVAKEGKYHFFVMDFVEGGNLRDFLRIRGKLSPL